MVNDNWKRIGFQSKNPRTDFRGGGVLGLLNLVYLNENYPEDWAAMVATGEDDSKMWLLAVSSINITHHLMVFLHMHDHEVSENYRRVIAGRNQFRVFCHLNYISKRAFFELHRYALLNLHYTWLQQIKYSGKTIP